MYRVILMTAGLLVSGSALADAVGVGNWLVEIEESYAETYTANASGSQFGLLCIGESCQFYLDTKTACKENAQIPMLINSDSGAVYVNTICMHFGSGKDIRYISAIEGTDAMTAISIGTEIGFAVPLAGGQFRVVRFSLNGALAATGKAANELPRLIKRRAAEGKLRDTTL